MTRITDLHKKWIEDPEYRKEYEGLEEEFRLLRIKPHKGATSRHVKDPSPLSKRPAEPGSDQEIP